MHPSHIVSKSFFFSTYACHDSVPDKHNVTIVGHTSYAVLEINSKDAEEESSVECREVASEETQTGAFHEWSRM